MVTLRCSIALLLSTPALADDIHVLSDADGDPIWLLEPSPGHWTEVTGFGNPSVAYDDRASQYVMYFESRIYDEWLFNGPADTPAGLGLDPRSYDDCRLGRDPANPAIVWAIGRATSPDGFAWTVDPWPVVLPAPGTWYACQVAQPAAIIERHNRWHLYFKAMWWNPNASSPERVDPCSDGPTPPWGCARVTGFGRAVSTDGRTFTPDGLVLTSAAATAATGVPTDQLGFPRVSSLSHDWYLWFTATPRVYQALAARPEGPFAPDPAPIVDYPGEGDGRLVTGAVFCREGVPPAAMLDGRKSDPNGECGLGMVATVDLEQWTRRQEEPALAWACGTGWDRWEVLDAQGDLVLWYSAADGTGATAPRRVGFAATSPLATEPPYATILGDALGTKVCKKAPVMATPLQGWTVGLPPLPPSAVPEPPRRGCSSVGGPPAGVTALPWLILAALTGPRRRRGRRCRRCRWERGAAGRVQVAA